MPERGNCLAAAVGTEAAAGERTEEEEAEVGEAQSLKSNRNVLELTLEERTPEVLEERTPEVLEQRTLGAPELVERIPVEPLERDARNEAVEEVATAARIVAGTRPAAEAEVAEAGTAGSVGAADKKLAEVVEEVGTGVGAVGKVQVGAAEEPAGTAAAAGNGAVEVAAEVAAEIGRVQEQEPGRTVEPVDSADKHLRKSSAGVAVAAGRTEVGATAGRWRPAAGGWAKEPECKRVVEVVAERSAVAVL